MRILSLVLAVALIFSCTNEVKKISSGGTEGDPENTILLSGLHPSNVTDTGFEALVDFSGDDNLNASAILWYCNETDSPGCNPLIGASQTMVRGSSVFTVIITGLSSPDDPGDTVNIRVVVTDVDGVTGSPLNGQLTLNLNTPGEIIADHTVTGISVPGAYIDLARANLRLAYGHTSHGSQIVSGMAVLMDLYPGGIYDYNHDGSGGALSLYDGNPSGDLGNPDRVTWAERTRELLNGGGSDRNVIMWSWCGQVSGASSADIVTYLNLMSQLEEDFPNVTFIYMTGHLDGGGESGNLHLRNEQIRAHCNAHNSVLFDFADIESYDPDGEYFLDRGANDNCAYNGGNWAVEWCAANPDDELCSACASCAHSQSLNCNLKARAFWWMMARLAGWDGYP